MCNSFKKIIYLYLYCYERENWTEERSCSVNAVLRYTREQPHRVFIRWFTAKSDLEVDNEEKFEYVSWFLVARMQDKRIIYS